MLGDVLWDTGAQEGTVGRHHLERWSEIERTGLAIKEEFDLPSGIGGTVQPVEVAHVPVGLAGV